MSTQTSPNHQSPISNHLPPLAAALILAALHVYVTFLPRTPAPIPGPEDAESAWWGLWPVTYMPRWLVWLGAALVAALVVWGFRHVRAGKADEFVVPARWLWTAAALLFAAFWAFPIVHTRWGDAYILANAVGWPDPALRLTHSWQAPLDVFLHSRIWHWLSDPLGWQDAVPVYRLLSPLAGGLYLWIVVRLSLDKRIAPGWVTFGLLASLGLLQLFFGYIENYSFAAVGILAYLWMGLGVVRGDRPLWLTATVLAVTNATHPSTVIYAPSLLWLAYVDWRRRGHIVAALLAVAVPMILVAGGTIGLMEAGSHGIAALLETDRPGGGDGRWLVPLFATSTRWEHYTMFSWLHLRDLINQQLLVAPVILPALILGWIGTIWRRSHLDLDSGNGIERGLGGSSGFEQIS
ncbi:MAG: hypothetical protein KDD84_08125, partial [Caldilineaceae bacterium]|nr:hypothetical protein [Caldilineaceae bacterium]